MAESILRQAFPEYEIYSAGSHPESQVNPYALEVMKEIGIDISQNKPKSVENFLKDRFDYVITLCDNARQTCPTFLGEVKHRVHIGFEDPAQAKGTREEVLPIYRKVRDEIQEKLIEFFKENMYHKNK